jgi:Haem-degrading
MRIRILTSLAFGVAMILSTGASAQQPAPPPGYGSPGVTLDQARKAVQAAEAEAAKNGWHMAIVVVTNEGDLILFNRMDDTQSLERGRDPQGEDGRGVPPADQGVSGRGHRHSAGNADPDARRHRGRGRIAADRERKGHRRHRLQRRHRRRGRASLPGRRCHHQLIVSESETVATASSSRRAACATVSVPFSRPRRWRVFPGARKAHSEPLERGPDVKAPGLKQGRLRPRFGALGWRREKPRVRREAPQGQL